MPASGKHCLHIAHPMQDLTSQSLGSLLQGIAEVLQQADSNAELAPPASNLQPLGQAALPTAVAVQLGAWTTYRAAETAAVAALFSET